MRMCYRCRLQSAYSCCSQLLREALLARAMRSILFKTSFWFQRRRETTQRGEGSSEVLRSVSGDVMGKEEEWEEEWEEEF